MAARLGRAHKRMCYVCHMNTAPTFSSPLAAMMLPFGAHCALAARCVALLVTSVLGSILCKGDELPHLLGQDVIPAVGPLGRDESEGRLIDKDAFRKMLHTHVAGAYPEF